MSAIFDASSPLVVRLFHRPSFPLDMAEEEGSKIGEKKRVCKLLACAIQTCLKRRDYDEKRCTKEISDWQKCDDELKILEALER